MSELVDPSEIEAIFGTPRREFEHLVMVKDSVMYIMHSRACVDTGRDLRECLWSVAMDEGDLGPNWPIDEV